MMSAQRFTPSDVVDMKKEKDWVANIGMMDWDSTNIVFTKRSLIEFLKYTGITVDTNFMNVSKLPRYARFGKISDETAVEEQRVDEEGGRGRGEDTGKVTDAAAPDVVTDYRPSRRVRTGPGGPSSSIFEVEFGDDALSQAPARKVAVESPPKVETTIKTDGIDEPAMLSAANRPSRRVRTAPGGKDSLSELWGPVEPEFKPTRRVRQGPGGQDSVGALFGP
ncbi:hypothetical protein DFH11DRAFT_1633166 [Phellopilus nigrolimitatus]|nr:hypothetical protein DFH11DRAFT_1633166 [Phellopilus nigrolimitatus]